MRLSVIIPTKDRPVRIVRAVVSVLSQLADGDRVIVVDDGSTPPTKARLRQDLSAQGAASDERISLLRHDTAQGPASARNTGVEHADTPMIVFLDDDDAFEDGYLDRLRAFWAQHADIDYGYSATATSTASQTGGTFEVLPAKPARAHLFPLSCGVWIKRDAFQAMGGLQTDLRTNEDTEFCIALMRHGRTGVFFSGAGVAINAADAQADRAKQGDAASITRSMKTAERARCFVRILERHGEYLIQKDAKVFHDFCVRRTLELQAKAGLTMALPPEIAKSFSPFAALKWRLIYWANRIGRRVASPKGTQP